VAFGDRASPRRPLLARVPREEGAEANDASLEGDDETTDALFGKVARELGVMNTRIGALEANGTLTVEEVRKLSTAVTSLITVVHPQAMREPAPSFTDASFDNEDEVITAHGTQKYAWTEDALRARMRDEYLKLQRRQTKKDKEAEVVKKTEADAKPYRYFKATVIPMILAAVVTFAVQQIVNAVKPVPVVAPAPSHS